MIRLSRWLPFLLLPLAGCAPRLRVAWYYSPTEFAGKPSPGASKEGEIYLAVVNEHHATVVIDQLVVNGHAHILSPPLDLVAGRFELFPMSSLLGECGVPYRVEIHPQRAWRWARVRGLATMPDAVPSKYKSKTCVVTR